MNTTKQAKRARKEPSAGIVKTKRANQVPDKVKPKVIYITTHKGETKKIFLPEDTKTVTLFFNNEGYQKPETHFVEPEELSEDEILEIMGGKLETQN